MIMFDPDAVAIDSTDAVLNLRKAQRCGRQWHGWGKLVVSLFRNIGIM